MNVFQSTSSGPSSIQILKNAGTSIWRAIVDNRLLTNFPLRSGKPTLQHTVVSKLTSFSWVYEPQSTWLINQPVHILRFRHLSDDFARLVGVKGLSMPAELPRLNSSQGGNRTPSSVAREFLQRIYAADFGFIESHGLDV